MEERTRRALIEYEVKYTRRRDRAEQRGSSVYLTEPSTCGTGVERRITSAVLNGKSSTDFNEQAEFKFKQWKKFVSKNSNRLSSIVDKVQEPVLQPRKARPSSPKKMTFRPRSAVSFSRAMNGLREDIEKQKYFVHHLSLPMRPTFSPILPEDSWDERFILEKPLSPPISPRTSSPTTTQLKEYSNLNSNNGNDGTPALPSTHLLPPLPRKRAQSPLPRGGGQSLHSSTSLTGRPSTASGRLQQSTVSKL
jgi:hypothetical protein